MKKISVCGTEDQNLTTEAQPGQATTKNLTTDDIDEH